MDRSFAVNELVEGLCRLELGFARDTPESRTHAKATFACWLRGHEAPGVLEELESWRSRQSELETLNLFDFEDHRENLISAAHHLRHFVWAVSGDEEMGEVLGRVRQLEAEILEALTDCLIRRREWGL